MGGPKDIPSQKPRTVFDFRDYLGKDPGPPVETAGFQYGTPPRTDCCPACHRPMWAFKWYWYYEASRQPWKAFLYRILNR